MVGRNRLTAGRRQDRSQRSTERDTSARPIRAPESAQPGYQRRLGNLSAVPSGAVSAGSNPAGAPACDQQIPAMTSQNVFWLRSVAPPGPDTARHRPPVSAPQVHPSRSPRSPALALVELYGLLFLSAG